jgi:hypothetical protein
LCRPTLARVARQGSLDSFQRGISSLVSHDPDAVFIVCCIDARRCVVGARVYVFPCRQRVSAIREQSKRSRGERASERDSQEEGARERNKSFRVVRKRSRGACAFKQLRRLSDRVAAALSSWALTHSMIPNKARALSLTHSLTRFCSQVAPETNGEPVVDRAFLVHVARRLLAGEERELPNVCKEAHACQSLWRTEWGCAFAPCDCFFTEHSETQVSQRGYDSKYRSGTSVQYRLCCVVFSHYVPRTHCRSPAVPLARLLAMNVFECRGGKGAKFLHEVH